MVHKVGVSQDEQTPGLRALTSVIVATLFIKLAASGLACLIQFPALV